MDYQLEKVALRYGALYLPGDTSDRLTRGSAALVEILGKHGFALGEEALHAANALSQEDIEGIAAVIGDIYGDSLNWASLIKNWTVPTGETWEDHVIAKIANMLSPCYTGKGTTLPCGHFIPEGLFDLSRYNGCPLCGKPFNIARGTLEGQGSMRTVLKRFTDDDLENIFKETAASPLPPDATALDSLRILSETYILPDGFKIGNIESAVAISAGCFDAGDYDAAFALLDSPMRLMRMLWMRQTGHTRIIRPAQIKDKERIRLHYTRRECRAVAEWLDTAIDDIDRTCATMHPYRGMWVRFIRALRLYEYARERKLGRLAALLDRFYRNDYPVPAGELEAAWLKGDATSVFNMLRSNPGTFARTLFASMLHFPDSAIENFRKVTKNLEPRLLVTLDSYAADYFMPETDFRIVTLADGRRVSVPLNKNLETYTGDERGGFARQVKETAIDALLAHYSKKYSRTGGNICIAKELYDIPVPIGDRGTAIADAESALQGQRFAVKGDNVRLFLQWGKGLPAQHLDMDLSAKLVNSDGSSVDCAYYNLSVPGATHSGDIQHIPDKVGTAEYIELDLPALHDNGTRYVIFACNAYSSRSLSPNLQVGWMDSDNPMKVDEETGVAYDPSTVSQMIHIGESELSRGLVFGILDVDAREITWLEMPNGTQRLDQLDAAAVEAYLHKLHSKITIGELLELYASARGCGICHNPESDCAERYTLQWAKNPAAVAGLLL